MPVFLCKGGIFINKYYKPNPNAGTQKPSVNPNDQKRLPDKNNGDLVNESIRFPEVLVIDPNGTQLGVMKRYDAIRAAQEMDLDLLCVAPNAKPPVCKILNYGKYRFELQKKQKEAKKNQTIVQVKEIQLTPVIGIHDLETKVKAAIRFFQDGNKVKVALRFKGRQLSHVEVGEEIMNKFLELVDEYAVVEKKPVLDGKLLTAVLASKGKK
ncbi:MAG: translation initiation factor IF-3 [Bacilli bacterium]|nr:translation initiation factor IF-3 [Bacilli bacterium]